MQKSFIAYILIISFWIACIACEDKAEKVQLPTTTDKNKTILTEITTEPKGAEIKWRIFSTNPKIKSSIAFVSLGKTPYREKRVFNIPDIKSQHIQDLFLVLEIYKDGYHKIVEVLKIKDALKNAKIIKKYKLEKLNIITGNSLLKGFQYFLPAKAYNKITKTTKTHSKNVKKDSKSANVYSKPAKDAKVLAIKKPSTKKPSVIGVIDKDPYEPNNNPKEAKAIYVNREYLSKLDNKKDEDYYMIFLGEKPKYKLELDKLPSKANYKVEMLTSSKKQKKVYELKTSKTKSSLAIRLKDKKRKTGIYCIKVSHLSGPTGQYRLKVKVDR